MKSFTISGHPESKLSAKPDAKSADAANVTAATSITPATLRLHLSDSLLHSDSVRPLVGLVEEAEERATKPWYRRLPDDIEK